ncbi:hypothetical protein A1QO_06265 [Vibrio genomosp. F10 str. ZF-129]|uniref:DNA-binding protein n=1 Tax=Vibrio genomosp. F10 str. ZF-129 TaxID=1187848 RepID=A0A1E5BG42_9VIBR|nr:H-NS family nucleoid-associated regulatory protein [Vibrio genomosp. F10]OEE34986.1 hypothetical protein A1QO_06265 [Vibrio genomosp. F10 str. ZF-129]
MSNHSLINTLLNERTCLKLLESIPLNDLKVVLTHVESVYAKKSAEALEEEKQKEMHLKKMENLLAEMEEAGIDVSELVNLEERTRKEKNRRPPRPPKYKYTTSEGEEKTWTGQGRTPRAIQEKIDNGLKLKDFLI